MKYKAVIFDFFGTLVDSSTRKAYENVAREMAAVLGAPPDAFARLWFDTAEMRMTGVLKSPEGNIKHICQHLHVACTDEQVKRASEIRTNFTVEALKPRPDTLETLADLRARGLKIGLISDCSSEVPAAWDNTPFAELIDAAIFSCSVGMKKPDPRIFRTTTEQLGVKPQECLYVGDGSSHELTGAKKVGMHPVLIRVPYEKGGDAYRIDAEEWHGPTISSLKEVLDLLE